MRMRNILRTTLLASSVSIVVPAMAQNTAEHSTSSLEEIVVTAQKRSESLQDVPVSIVAVSSEALENAGVLDTKALQRLTPGLTWFTAVGINSVFLRGIGSNLVPSGLENSVAMYVDSVYYPRAFGNSVNMVDVERVEVLKGPQGTLFGRNATGGVVRILTKDVSDELEGNVKFSYGNYDALVASGVANLPVTDGFGMRLVAQKRKHDGYRRNIGNAPGALDRLDSEDTEDVRLKAKWDITDDATLQLSGTYFHRDDSNGLGVRDITNPQTLSTIYVAGGRTGGNQHEVASDLQDLSETRTYTASARLDWNIGDYTFVSDTSYITLEDHTVIDYDASDLYTNITDAYTNSDSYAQDFQLLSPTDGRFEWVFGLYGFYEDNNLEQVITFPPGISFSYSYQQVKTEAFAPYGQVTWNVSDAWAVTLGARYSYEKKEVLQRPTQLPGVLNGLPPFLLALLPYRAEKSWNEFTPKLTVEYHVTPDTMVYATYAKGFKSGGYNFPALGLEPPLDSELLDMYELGIKGSAENFRYASSAYYYDYKDLQVQQYISDGISVSENAGRAPIYGLEANFDWAITDALSLSGSVEWLIDAKYEDFPLVSARSFINPTTGVATPGTKIVPYNASGHPLLYAPDVSASLNALYNVNVGAGTIPISTSLSYKGVMYSAFLVDSTVEDVRQGEDYFMTARIGFVPASEKWNVGVWISNIFDSANPSVLPLPNMRASYADPRTYGIDFTANF